MSLKLLLIASFFVSLIAMLGTAPMVRRMAVKLKPRTIHSQTPVGAGGVSLGVALLLVSFYLIPLPASANALLAGLVVVLVFNGLLWWRLRPRRARLWRNRLGPLVMLLVVPGLIGIPADLIFDYTGAILTVGFVVAVSLTPLALAGLGDRFPVRSTMSPSYLIVPAMLGIIIMSLKADFAGGPAFRTMIDVMQVFLPTFGAIAGCSFYTLRLPWRSGSLICMGASGQMMMGLVFGWAALLAAAAAPRPGATMVALLWMMLPALFEVMREQIRVRIAPTLDPDQLDPRIIGLLLMPTSARVIYGNAVAMLIAGLVSFWTPLVSVWASGVMIPFVFMAYVLGGGWLSRLLKTAEPTLPPYKSSDTRR